MTRLDSTIDWVLSRPDAPVTLTLTRDELAAIRAALRIAIMATGSYPYAATLEALEGVEK